MRHYDKEFKLNALAMLKEGKTQAQICRDLGVPETTFHDWVVKYRNHGQVGFSGSGNIRDSEKELISLQKELADARLERDILKKAIAIFSKQK